MRWSLLALAVAAVTISACGSASSDAGSAVPGLPDDAIVTYDFLDSSVPPPYHRSLHLTVSRDTAHLVIDSYGDVLADEAAVTPASAWTAMGESLASVSSLTVADPQAGCTGGTGMHLTVTSSGASLVDLAPEFCAGSNEGLDEAIEAWIAPARRLFAGTEILAPTG